MRQKALHFIMGPFATYRNGPVSSNVTAETMLLRYPGIYEMTLFAQRLVVAACAMALIACTTLQPLSEQGKADTTRAQRQAQSVVVGDTLRIKLNNAAAFELLVTAVDSDSITGKEDGKDRRVLIAEVESLEQNRFNALRTALLVGSLVLIALGQYAKGVSKLTNP